MTACVFTRGEWAGYTPSQGQKNQLSVCQRRAAYCLQHWGILSERNKDRKICLGRLLAYETQTCLKKPRQEGKYKVGKTLLTLFEAKHGVNVRKPN